MAVGLVSGNTCNCGFDTGLFAGGACSHRAPALSFVAEVEAVGVEDFGENFQGFDQSGARAVEVAMAVHREDLPAAHGGELGEAREFGEGCGFPAGAFQVESAGHDDEDVRILVEDLLPLDPG